MKSREFPIVNIILKRGEENRKEEFSLKMTNGSNSVGVTRLLADIYYKRPKLIYQNI